MAMKRCPDCGEKYSDSYKYCPFCEEEEILREGKALYGEICIINKSLLISLAIARREEGHTHQSSGQPGYEK